MRKNIKTDIVLEKSYTATFYVNDEPYIAFGGVKASGIGRFGREHSLDEFTTWKWISVQEEARDYPFD